MVNRRSSVRQIKANTNPNTHPQNYRSPSGAHYPPPPPPAPYQGKAMVPASQALVNPPCRHCASILKRDVRIPRPPPPYQGMAMLPTSQAFVNLLYRHVASILKRDVVIVKDSLRFVPLHPGRFMVKFGFDAHVSCRTNLASNGRQGVYIKKKKDTNIRAETLNIVLNHEDPGYFIAEFTFDASVLGRATFYQATKAVSDKEKDECQVCQNILVNNMVRLWHDISRFGSHYDWNYPAKERLPCSSTSQHTMTENSSSLRVKLCGRRITNEIGKISVLDKVLGMGGNGTVVYQGLYGQMREIAVKRMLKEHQDVALKESEILIKSDYHRNIVRWYGVEKDLNFVYIALELCVCSLHALILSLREPRGKMHPIVEDFKDLELWEHDLPSLLLLKLIWDTANGLAHLHELGIIHRDLKPQNVLICKHTCISAKVSDMGISKLLPEGAHSLSKSTSGSSGWKAPERLLLNERETNTVDSFSLGCLIYFCITRGEHPFGKDQCDRDRNIKKDKKDLSSVANIPEAHDLISRLLDPDPKSRLQVAAVLNHPLFWDPKKRLDFLQSASDRAEEERITLKDRQKQVSAEVLRSELLDSLESKGPDVFGVDWGTKLDGILLNNLKGTKQKKYIYNSLCSLLRAIRNKLHHYPEEVEAVIGTIPAGFEEYFRLTFPELLMVVYEVLKEHCGEENGFLLYYN